MIPISYLQGLQIAPFEGCPGVFAAEDYRSERAWRYLSSYSDGKRHKVRIFSLLRQHGQREIQGRWDLHHVVEGQHFADVDFSGVLPTAYHQTLPCVLIHKNEHVAYNQLLHIKETDEMFRDRLPRELEQRSREAALEAADPRKHTELRLRVQRLQDLYRNAYRGDPVLQKIAQNVLSDVLLKLR